MNFCFCEDLDGPDMPRHWLRQFPVLQSKGHRNTASQKQTEPFVRSPTLRQLSLILLVNKGSITAHLSQPLDEDSKGLSIRDALIKHKLLNGAEILK